MGKDGTPPAAMSENAMKRSCLLLLLFLSPPAIAGDNDCRVASDHPLIGGTNWYGVYFEDKKIGHATQESQRVPIDGEIAIDLNFFMTFRAGDSEAAFSDHRRYEGAPPHRLVGGQIESDGLHTAFRRDGNSLLITDENGAHHRMEGVDRTLCDEEGMAVFDFLETVSAAGVEIETKDLDVQHLAETKAVHRVLEVGSQMMMGVPVRIHKVASTYHEHDMRITAETVYQSREPVQFFFGPFELRRETEAVALAPNQSVDLMAEFQKPLNRPLEALDDIETLTLRVSIDDPTISINDVIDDQFLQTVDVIDDQTARVTIADRKRPPSAEISSLYLRSTSNHPADLPIIETHLAAAMQGVEDRSDQHRLVESLVSYVSDFIDDAPNDLYGHNTSSVTEILENRFGDCTEHSQLFVTLARAAGIPAREVTGFVYNGDDEEPALAGHMWAEVQIDGHWIGVDPTWNEIELNRSHVQTQNDFVPSLAFEVVDIGYR
jgi:hypothetical protein